MPIFKYFHPDRSDVLRDGTIRFSSPKVLNDPFELKPHISAFSGPEFVAQEIDRLLPEHSANEYAKLSAEQRTIVSLEMYRTLASGLVAPYAKREWEQLMQTLLPEIRNLMSLKIEEMLGILCLTESPANLLMWAHYGDSHQGFVVEFDPESPFFSQFGPQDDFRRLQKVIYRDERPAVVLTEMADFSPFLTKGKDWSYEAEWRAMMPLSMASQVIGDGPAAIHLFAYPKSMVRRVIFGCRMTDSKKAEICQLLRVTPGYEHVQTAETRIDDRHYRVVITDHCGANFRG